MVSCRAKTPGIWWKGWQRSKISEKHQTCYIFLPSIHTPRSVEMYIKWLATLDKYYSHDYSKVSSLAGKFLTMNDYHKLYINIKACMPSCWLSFANEKPLSIEPESNRPLCIALSWAINRLSPSSDLSKRQVFLWPGTMRVRVQPILDADQTIIISKSKRVGIDITVFTLNASLQLDWPFIQIRIGWGKLTEPNEAASHSIRFCRIDKLSIRDKSWTNWVRLYAENNEQTWERDGSKPANRCRLWRFWTWHWS